MKIRTRILALWKDPVGSNIIAGIIIAIAGYLWVRLATGRSASPSMSHPVVMVGVPGLALAVMLLAWHRFRGSNKTLVFVS